MVFLLHQLFQFDVEMAFGLVGYEALHDASPGRAVAGAFVFEDADELDDAEDG